jgi:hypothetical protein
MLRLNSTILRSRFQSGFSQILSELFAFQTFQNNDILHWWRFAFGPAELTKSNCPFVIAVQLLYWPSDSDSDRSSVEGNGAIALPIGRTAQQNKQRFLGALHSSSALGSSQITGRC